MRWLAIAVLLAACMWPRVARAERSPSVQASATTHGLRITLRAARRSYPAGAVIRVTLTIRNVSRRAISIMSGLDAPRFQVTDGSGQVVFDSLQPLGSQTLFIATGPGPVSDTLARGAASTIHSYVVLSGRTLATTLILGDFLHHIPPVTIAGPQMHFRLTSEQPPSVAISTNPLSAKLTSAVPVSSRFVWFSETHCVDTDGNGSAVRSGWVPRGNGRFRPLGQLVCAHLTWHAIAGWLGHPIATVTYDSAAP
jgi:hypothetical protein